MKKNKVNNKVDCQIIVYKTDWKKREVITKYYESDFPNIDRGEYNPITFFTDLQKLIGEVYKKGGSKSRWNSKYGYYQNVKELINIHIHKRYDEFYNEWIWGIDEMIHYGKYSYDGWKSVKDDWYYNNGNGYQKSKNGIKSLSEVVELLFSYLNSFDKKVFEDEGSKYFSNIKKNYGIKEFDDYGRLIDRVELMLKETDKHKDRLSNKREKTNKKLNEKYERGEISEVDMIIGGNLEK